MLSHIQKSKQTTFPNIGLRHRSTQSHPLWSYREVSNLARVCANFNRATHQPMHVRRAN